MLTVVCMKWGTLYGAEYVRRLRAGVARHLPAPHRFVCITDDASGLDGIDIDCLVLRDVDPASWNQLQLFRPGLFPAGERILAIDLDTIVTGPLDGVVDAGGAIHLKDWGWERDVVFGGLMVWTAGEHAELWERRDSAQCLALRRSTDPRVNLQDWLTVVGWPRLPAHLVRSYRYHAVDRVPADCRAVCFHGRPKPHEISAGWVPQAWGNA